MAEENDPTTSNAFSQELVLKHVELVHLCDILRSLNTECLALLIKGGL